MKLKLLAPFRTRGFALRSEASVVDLPDYVSFWDELASGEPLIAPPHKVRYAHAARYANSIETRYDRIDVGTLPRSLHVIEVEADVAALDGAGLLKAAAEAQRGENADAEIESSWTRTVDGLVERLDKQQPQMLIRVFGNTVSLAEVDLELGRLLKEVDDAHLGPILDRLQHTGIEYARRLIDAAHKTCLQPLFQAIIEGDHDGEAWIRHAPRFYAMARGDGPGQRCTALWVTRTLAFEPGEFQDASDTGRRDRIIGHWLADVGDAATVNEVIANVTGDSGASCVQWLNYCFREDSYPGAYPEGGWRRAGNELARPFCDTWEALLDAQYYYAAFETHEEILYRILATSFDDRSGDDLADLREQLDEAVKASTLLLLDYRTNFKYYQRTVSSAMNEILGYWQLEDILLAKIKESIEACGERLQTLHERASERSTFYTELILLAIGLTGVFGILMEITSYGREMAADADLALYEGESGWNFVNWIAAHSTNYVLFVSAGISLVLFLLYIVVRKRRLVG